VKSKKKRWTPEHKDALKQSWPIVIAAVLYTLAFPTANLWPLSFVCLIPVIALVLEAGTSKRAFWFGFLAGCLGNLGKLYFLIYTINHYGHFPLPAAILVELILCATLGSFWGGTFWAARRMMSDGKIPLWLSVCASWMFLEWFLTWFLTGFPWELLGHALIGWLPMAQAADVIGGLGLSFPVIFGNVVGYEIYRFVKKRRETFPLIHVGALIAMLAALVAYGFVRMPQIDRLAAKGDSIRVGMLQANIDQNDKWQDDSRDRT
jgi:apolipoprotein N-acyltransferase